VDWKGEVFKNLHEAKRGDEIHVYTDDREYLYLVQDIQIVLEDGATDAQKRQNARFMDPTPDQTLTLITCYPYGIDNHRLIVIAKPYDSGLPARPDFIVK
jgi:sortase A